MVELWAALVHTSWRRGWCRIYLWACSKEILQWALHHSIINSSQCHIQSLLWNWYSTSIMLMLRCKIPTTAFLLSTAVMQRPPACSRLPLSDNSFHSQKTFWCCSTQSSSWRTYTSILVWKMGSHWMLVWLRRTLGKGSCTYGRNWPRQWHYENRAARRTKTTLCICIQMPNWSIQLSSGNRSTYLLEKWTKWNFYRWLLSTKSEQHMHTFSLIVLQLFHWIGVGWTCWWGDSRDLSFVIWWYPVACLG